MPWIWILQASRAATSIIGPMFISHELDKVLTELSLLSQIPTFLWDSSESPNVNLSAHVGLIAPTCKLPSREIKQLSVRLGNLGERNAVGTELCRSSGYGADIQ